MSSEESTNQRKEAPHIWHYDEKTDQMYLMLPDGKSICLPFKYVFPKWGEAGMPFYMSSERELQKPAEANICTSDFEKIFRRLCSYFE